VGTAANLAADRRSCKRLSWSHLRLSLAFLCACLNVVLIAGSSRYVRFFIRQAISLRAHQLLQFGDEGLGQLRERLGTYMHQVGSQDGARATGRTTIWLVPAQLRTENSSTSATPAPICTSEQAFWGEPTSMMGRKGSSSVW
jgi:hypothetical protein